ncbi:hypothetical protein HO133_002547 [Letharia lupina]|uniref:Uncharacterized protein n=1 Tax=Letharia lupina TaxID=560253 RepID=A0A8H6FA22_9LECA|nr:uncharacterized protein HO133_002547 [Letharia lupina]KAF6220867.1 hypothetical protein HO133_002547 [Letharia lupina]
MHLSHLPQTLLILLLALAPTALTLPDPLRPQRQIVLDPRSPEARQQRLEAWKAQKPMHTTALLAGAAATAVRNGRRRDLSGITGEKGMWIPVGIWDGGDEVDGGRGREIGDVRGGEGLVLGLEDGVEGVEGDGGVFGVEGVEGDGGVFGVRDVVERVWKRLEKIGLVVQRGRHRVDKVKELDGGHDGDL